MSNQPMYPAVPKLTTSYPAAVRLCVQCGRALGKNDGYVHLACALRK